MIGNPFSRRQQREGWDDESNNHQDRQNGINSSQISNSTINPDYGTILNTEDSTVSWTHDNIISGLQCTVCDNVAKYIYNGNSLCEECINRYRIEQGE